MLSLLNCVRSVYIRKRRGVRQTGAQRWRRKPLWDATRAQHGLRDYALDQLASRSFANWLYSTDYDIMSSTTKLRQADWTRVVDSEAMYLRLLQELRDDRIIP